MTALARSSAPHGAQSDISGEISIHAKWSEDMYFYDASDGSAQDLTGLTFYMQFRSDPEQTGADVTLSTTAGTLTITADGDGVNSILRIAVPSGTFASYPGDMICDLVAVDGSGNETHYGHGVVSFQNNPVSV